MPFILEFDDISLREFDLGGVLYHANYFSLYEKTREAYLKKIKIPYPSLVSAGFHLAITETSQKFIAPIYYGDKIKIELKSTKVASASFEFDYLFKKENIEIHTAKTKHVYVDVTNKKLDPKRMPKALKEAILKIAQS